MADLASPQQDGILRSTSDTPPSHYIVKINLFSQLTKNSVESYTQAILKPEATNAQQLPHIFLSFHWRRPKTNKKLVLHPNGNKSKDVNDHLSLYLLIAEVNSLSPGWEARVVFRLFLLDQHRDTYSTLQDTAENGRRFHKMKLECGFDKFLPLTAFKDPANGYLVNDTCVFGAEVYVRRENPTWKGESLLMIKDPITYKHTCKIDNISSLTDECVDSKPFTAANRKWKIQLHPRGKGSGADTYISLYLSLAEPQDLLPASKLYAEFTLRILDQVNRNHYFGTANYWYSSSSSTCGWPRFVSRVYFNTSTAGLVLKDACLVEAEVKVHGVSTGL